MTDNGGYRDEQKWYDERLLSDQEILLAEGGGAVIPEGFSVHLTCTSCPEQWDIRYDGGQIGYLRCRSSRWSLTYPDLGWDAEQGCYTGEVLISEDWHPERGQYESNFDDERPAVFERVFRVLIERHLRAKVSHDR